MHTSQKVGFGQSFKNGKENIERGSLFGLILIIILSSSNSLTRMTMK